MNKLADAAAGEPTAEVSGRLALSGMLWWGGEKDAALGELARAVKLVPGDSELKLSLAELRAQRGESDEALAVVDSVEATDQKILQRRELLALRVAAQANQGDRARLAAERLFGLRLDSTTQVLLAAQMHQLGMHDLAEAVMSRARRHAGNNVEAMVAIMQQYQRQGKVDEAAQVAYLIIRRTPDAGSRRSSRRPTRLRPSPINRPCSSSPDRASSRRRSTGLRRN